MNLNDYSLVQNLTEAYLDVYEQEEVLDEVRGGGRIDPVSDIPGIGERGARSPKDAGLLMSPLARAKARANALTKKGNTKQANQINSRFVNPTERAVNRSLLAATNAKDAEKTRLMNPQESYDLYDLVLSHLLDEGYADTNENALAIMASMSEEWRESIVEAGRMHSASDQQAYWHSQNTSNNSKQKSDKEIENEKGGKEFLERIKKTKKNPKYKA